MQRRAWVLVGIARGRHCRHLFLFLFLFPNDICGLEPLSPCRPSFCLVRGRPQFVRLDTAADIADFGSIKANLSKKSKKEAVDKLQQLMDQIAGCMDALQ